MAMVFTDAKEPDEPIVFANDSFLALTRYAGEEVLGKSFNSLMARGADAEALEQIRSAFAGGSDSDPEICYRRSDGSTFWASVFITPVRDASGAVVQHFASFVDLTKHRQEQERLRSLFGELNHRTQNTLTTVLALVGQTLRGMADEKVIKILESRILALSKVHGLLGRESWDGVGLREVIIEILQPFGLEEGKGARFSVVGDDVRLQRKESLTLAMVFHELATNAVNHGALSDGDAGRVDIAWAINSTPTGDRMRLRWTESGGPTVTPATRKGFGSRLIERGLEQELNGEVRLDHAAPGLVCEIVMPMAQTPMNGELA